jgi:hypothetical protein
MRYAAAYKALRAACAVHPPERQHQRLCGPFHAAAELPPEPQNRERPAAFITLPLLNARELGVTFYPDLPAEFAEVPSVKGSGNAGSRR